MLRKLLFAAALLLPGAALAQPACTTLAPTAVACQAPAVNPQLSDILLGQQATGPTRLNETVRFPLSTVVGVDHTLSPVTGNNITQTLGTWESYLAGVSDPNPVVFGKSLSAGGATGYGSWQMTPIQTSTSPTNGPSEVVGSQVANQVTVGWSGGTNGTVIAPDIDATIITGAPTNYIWDHLNSLQYSGTGGYAQHVAGYNQTRRNTYATGGASNNPQLWAGVMEVGDFTGQASVNTNSELSTEFDVNAANLDNGSAYQTRTNLSVIARVPAAYSTSFPQGCLSTSAYPCFGTMNGQVGIFAQNGMVDNEVISFGGPFINAVWDSRYAGSAAKGPATATPTPIGGSFAATITSTVTSSTTIPVSDVLFYTRDTLGRDINYNGTTLPISFSDGQTATVTGYTVTSFGATPAGTLTISAAQSHASGVKVYNTSSNAIWLGTGQGIALDDNGATTITSNGSVVTITGNLVVSNGEDVGATGIMIGSNAVIGVDANQLVLTFSLPIRAPGYALSALPSVTSGNEGSIVFCNDCTNLDETSGNATGALVTLNTDNTWRTQWGQVATTSTPTLTIAGGITVGTTPGVSCAANTVSLTTLTVINGIVTHC
jgi:hypothetical protein